MMYAWKLGMRDRQNDLIPVSHDVHLLSKTKQRTGNGPRICRGFFVEGFLERIFRKENGKRFFKTVL